MIGCVLSQLKPSEVYTPSYGIAMAKSVELLGLYPIQSQ